MRPHGRGLSHRGVEGKRASGAPLSTSELLDEQPERRRITVMFTPDAFR
jgi:hypothetical protein